MDIMYILAAVYNFINTNNPDNLDNNLKVKNEVVDKDDVGLAKAESNIVIN